MPLATALAGMASVHVGVNVWLPMPLFAEALKSFVAVGATVAAGNVYGKLTVVVPGVHPAAPVSHDAVGPDWIVAAVVGSAFVPDLKVVEVPVTFQPAPDPVASPMSNASVPVTDWLVPLSVVVGERDRGGRRAVDECEAAGAQCHRCRGCGLRGDRERRDADGGER